MSSKVDNYKRNQQKKFILVIVIIVITVLIGIGVFTGMQPDNTDEPETTVSQQIETEKTYSLTEVLHKNKESVTFSDFTLDLNSTSYLLYNDSNASYFIGNYTITEYDIANMKNDNIDLNKYDKAYVIRCFYSEHHYTTNIEYYNGNSKKSFDFLLLINTKRGEYEIADYSKLDASSFEKPIF